MSAWCIGHEFKHLDFDLISAEDMSKCRRHRNTIAQLARLQGAECLMVGQPVIDVRDCGATEFGGIKT